MQAKDCPIFQLMYFSTIPAKLTELGIACRLNEWGASVWADQIFNIR